jgi:hypothetical protein
MKRFAYPELPVSEGYTTLKIYFSYKVISTIDNWWKGFGKGSRALPITAYRHFQVDRFVGTLVIVYITPWIETPLGVG